MELCSSRCSTRKVHSVHYVDVFGACLIIYFCEVDADDAAFLPPTGEPGPTELICRVMEDVAKTKQLKSRQEESAGGTSSHYVP
jgi:hypothetical protein